MKAVVVNEDRSLFWGDVAMPKINREEVLIQISCTAINRADLMQRKGFYPPPIGASEVMGLECAGVVIEVGGDCARFKHGDKVCALLAGGGYGQFAAVHESSVLPIPTGLSDEEAAALPEVFATAWLNLFMEAGMKSGDKAIVHAGASGVGTTAIQLCKAFGASSFVTVGSEDKLRACVELGAGEGFNRHEGSFLKAAQKFSGQSGFDVILDPVGADYLNDNLTLLGLGGRLVLIGLMSGTKSELDLAQVMMRRLRIIGSTLRARTVVEKAIVMKQLEEKVWPKIASKEIKPVIEASFPITKVAEAHDLVSSNITIGKVILTVDH
jgi:putative PIG3 family NAD(P)H quinone oxidoreductase